MSKHNTTYRNQNRRRGWTPLRRDISRVHSYESLEDRCLLAAVPVVSLQIADQSMIGESVDFSVTFDNQATTAPTTGFGPYIDLFMDVTGTDGISPGGSEPTDYDGFDSGLSASYLGAALTVTPVTIGPGGTFSHPIATDATGAPRVGTAPAGFSPGDILFVVELPFGSYVDEQTPAEVEFSTSLSTEADLNVPLNVAAQGGFRYGVDPLDNPTTDNPITGPFDAGTTTPVVIQLFKEYIGTESETATGPNFPRRYRIRADIADGQTVNDLRLIDVLPNDLAFLSVVSTSPASTNERTPAIGAAANAPNNVLVELFNSVTGTTSSNDANVVFEFFVPDVDADGTNVLAPSTGNDELSINDAQATGTWQPSDPSDALVSINIVDQTDDNFELTNKSLAIQKSVVIVSDTGASGASPGDVLEYTLEFQVSDYFSFGDLRIEDIVSDGQRLAGSPSGPFTGPFTISVTDRNESPALSGNFTPSSVAGATNLFIDTSEIGNDLNPATDGTTRLVFDVSRAMTDLGASDGILQGGRAIVPDAGGANGTIIYRTIIQQSFSDDYPSGEATVDEGDILNNDVTISGTLRSNSAIGTVLDSESDGSSTSIEILTGALMKTTYAVNGVLGAFDASIDPDTGLVVGPSFANNLEVRPGDVVTYRLRYVLPTGDVEDFVITDFLPLPVYDASIISTTFGTTIDASAPAAESTKYGPDHTFSRVPAAGPPLVNPTVSLNATANSIEFDFGTFDNLPPESESVIDILLSTTITDAPMANGLQLTNMATTSHGTTNAGNHVVTAITQITLTEPDLNIRKGIVSTTNASASFAGRVAPSGIAFEAPGIVSGSSFTGGTIHSSNLGTSLNADLNNVDADDLVKFAITIENTGSSSAGVFDIQLRDSMPAGFVIPTSGPGLNLEVFDGTGAPMPFSTIGGGLFDPTGGIELTDPGPTPAVGAPAVNGGALDEFDSFDGRNIAVVTFDLQVDSNVVADDSLLNTAILFNFAGTEGGEDHTNPTDLTDTAVTNVSAPTTGKTLIQSSINNASNATREAVIGEIVTYELEVEIPEGTLPGASILDTLDVGLAFVDVLSVSTGSLSVENTIGLGTAPANTNITSNGRRVEFVFGDIDNNDTDNTTPETITIRYRAVVLNIGSNQSSPIRNLNNAARLRWTGGTVRPARARTVRVIEPDLEIVKTAMPASLDVADTVTYTVTLSHNTASTDAYDVTLSDIVPAGLSYVTGSWMNTAGLAPDSTSDVGTLSAIWAVFPEGATATFQFDAVVDIGALAGTTFMNTATVDWSSLSGPTPNDLSIYNSNSRERTGTGGVNDYINTSTADIEIAVSSAKSIISTSEATTIGADVTVGEIVRYRIAVLFPESVGPNFAILDNLPDGLEFLDDGTATIALVSDGGLSSSTLPAAVEQLGNSPVVTPTEVLPASAISGGPFGPGIDPTFSLGTLTNADSDPDGEYVVLEFNAIVSNVAGNIAGVDLVNSGSTLVGGTQVGLDSSNAIVNVVEPSISNLTKTPSVTTVDGDDSVTYRVRYSASNAADTTTAFDVQTVETLPPELTGLTNVRVFRNGASITTGFVNSSTASTLAVSIDVVSPSDVIEILYDVTVVDTTPTGTVIINNVDLLYTSLPGATGTTVNPTGSTAGPAGGTDGERTGSGGVNSYFGNTSSMVTMNSHEISGFVYHDANNNGIFDEPAANGIGATVVRIVGTDHLGNAIDTTQSTLADGSYSFSGLRPGSYSVSETQPVGFFNGLDSVGIPAMSAVNVSRTDDILGTFTFPVGAASTSSANNNFGELVPASITGNVYVDANNDGILSGELPIGAVPIRLTGIDDQGNAVSIDTTTNGAGGYSFSGLRPGTYTVTETAQPVGYLDGLETRDNMAPIPGSGGGTDVISGIVLSSGQTDGDNNFGEVPPGTVRGRVFTDANNDGLINGSDQGIGSVTIELTGTDVFGNTVSRATTTAADGTYSFVGLMEGTYAVTEPTQPARYFDGFDSLAGIPIGGSNSSDQINGVFLPSGGDVADNNFGEVPDVGPTGYVYIDTNTNGTRESTEPGIAGVEITLTGTGLDVFGNPIPTRTAFTGPDGFYEFIGVPPGNYTITETQPAAFQDAAEQNGTPAAGTVTNDQFSELDLTDYPTISGEYNFGEVSPTSSLSGAVYVDSNNNGVREPSEIGLAGVTVTLIDSGGTSYEVVTDANGQYRFVKMFPGQYRLVQTQPTNFIDGRETRGTAGGVVSNDQFSSINIGLDAVESGYLFGEAGINPALISKRAFLTSSNPGVDFTGPPGSGVAAVNAPLADPAGYVYVDSNGNGVFDYPEPGIPNVVISVRGVTEDGVSVEQETRTDVSGFYQFAFLRPGTYALYQQQPIGFADGRESVGTLGGIIGDDSITNIVIRDGDFGENYNFGELPLASVLVGDSNQDGIFDSTDLIRVFQANEYEDDVPGNSTFAEGDWNGDGDFNSTDLVLAFQSGHYVQALDQVFDDLATRRRNQQARRSAMK